MVKRLLKELARLRKKSPPLLRPLSSLRSDLRAFLKEEDDGIKDVLYRTPFGDTVLIREEFVLDINNPLRRSRRYYGFGLTHTNSQSIQRATIVRLADNIKER